MKKSYALAMKAILTHLPTKQSLPKTCRLTITYSADTPAYRATAAENMAVADDYANTHAYWGIAAENIWAANNYADTPTYRGTAAENMLVANDSAIKGTL